MNSSLAPVVLFRRRLKSVADVLKGIRNRGFTEVLGCSVSSWSLWSDLIPEPLGSVGPSDSHVFFYKWACDSLDVLSDFIKEVVVNRRDTGIRRWTRWLREDLGVRPYVWLRPDFVPPSPFLVVKDSLTKASSILVEPHLIDAEFRKAWMPFFCPVVSFCGSSSASGTCA